MLNCTCTLFYCHTLYIVIASSMEQQQKKNLAVPTLATAQRLTCLHIIFTQQKCAACFPFFEVMHQTDAETKPTLPIKAEDEVFVIQLEFNIRSAKLGEYTP